MSDAYYTSVICLNGHILTEKMEIHPEDAVKYCTKCGAETVQSCRECSTHIRGDWKDSNVVWLGKLPPPPGYCHDCGKPYPWTSSTLAAAREMALEAKNLTESEKGLLVEVLPDLLADTPKTQLATQRFKKLAKKAGMATWNAFHDLLVDVVSETVKKAIWGI